MRYEYIGDVNLKYGGAFIDLATFDEGYVSAVRIRDLDSAIGFTWAVLVEHLCVIVNDKWYWKHALDYVGLTVADLLGMDSDARRLALCDAVMVYGVSDPDDSWDNYRTRYSETIQTDEDGPMEFDGWKADKCVEEDDLDDYIQTVHLR